MLSLTKKTECGLLALTYMFHAKDELRSARTISQVCHIPLPLLMNILKTLAQNQVVVSVRGAQGGYKLAVPAEQVTLAQVINYLEGPAKLVQCIGDNGEALEYENRCELLGCCAIRSPMLEIHDKFEAFLDEITIAGLANHRPGTLTVLNSPVS